MTAQDVRALLVIPANNTTMEPELRAYCPEIRELRVARVPRPSRTLQVDDLPVYRASTLAVAAAVAKEGADVVIYGCTAAGFLAGPAGDAEVAAALSEGLGAPTVTTASAMVAALHHSRVARIDVVTPYLDPVNDGLRAYLAAGGIEVSVLDSFHCKTVEELGRIDGEQIFHKALATATPSAEGLLLACSQLPTRDVLPRLRRQLSRPVWSSVQATAWATLTRLSRPTDRLVA